MARIDWGSGVPSRGLDYLVEGPKTVEGDAGGSVPGRPKPQTYAGKGNMDASKPASDFDEVLKAALKDDADKTVLPKGLTGRVMDAVGRTSGQASMGPDSPESDFAPPMSDAERDVRVWLDRMTQEMRDGFEDDMRAMVASDIMAARGYPFDKSASGQVRHLRMAPVLDAGSGPFQMLLGQVTQAQLKPSPVRSRPVFDFAADKLEKDRLAFAVLHLDDRAIDGIVADYGSGKAGPGASLSGMLLEAASRLDGYGELRGIDPVTTLKGSHAVAATRLLDSPRFESAVIAYSQDTSPETRAKGMCDYLMDRTREELSKRHESGRDFDTAPDGPGGADGENVRALAREMAGRGQAAAERASGVLDAAAMRGRRLGELVGPSYHEASMPDTSAIEADGDGIDGPEAPCV